MIPDYLWKHFKRIKSISITTMSDVKIILKIIPWQVGIVNLLRNPVERHKLKKPEGNMKT